jgi:hypothetical protein
MFVERARLSAFVATTVIALVTEHAHSRFSIDEILFNRLL